MSKAITRIQPWERRDGENGWENFVRFRNIGAARTIAAVAAETGVALSTLKSQSVANGWVSRAEAYDRWLDAQRTEATADDEKNRARRQRQILNELGEVALLEVRKLLADAQNAGFSAMKTRDVLKAAEIVIKLSRLVDGQSSENIAVATADYGSLSTEELAQLEAIARKVSP